MNNLKEILIPLSINYNPNDNVDVKLFVPDYFNEVNVHEFLQEYIYDQLMSTPDHYAKEKLRYLSFEQVLSYIKYDDLYSLSLNEQEFYYLASYSSHPFPSYDEYIIQLIIE